MAMYFPYQHSSSHIKLLEELCDENVDWHQSFLVHFLYFPYDVEQPFKMALTSRHPYEIQLQENKI